MEDPAAEFGNERARSSSEEKERRNQNKAMAISANFGLFGTFAPSPKIKLGGHFTGGTKNLESTPKWPLMVNIDHNTRRIHCFGAKGNELFKTTVNPDTDEFLLNAVNLSFFDRLNLAWRILFPSAKARKNSNAKIAKQRLKMILFSDRCDVTDEAKRKIVGNIVEALSDIVEINRQDKVQLSVSRNPNLGTVYSVVVPVRRVKPEYQVSDNDYRGMTSVEYNGIGETSGSVDVKFDFFVPTEN